MFKIVSGKKKKSEAGNERFAGASLKEKGRHPPPYRGAEEGGERPIRHRLDRRRTRASKRERRLSSTRQLLFTQREGGMRKGGWAIARRPFEETH